MLHARQADRGKGHGHGHVLADHLGRRLATFHVDGHALLEIQLVKIRGVFAEGLFGPTAGFGVVIEHLRHATFVNSAQVFDFSDDSHDVSLGFIG